MDPGLTPPDLRGKSPVLVGKVKTDAKPWGQTWGQVLEDVGASYVQVCRHTFYIVKLPR